MNDPGKQRALSMMLGRFGFNPVHIEETSRFGSFVYPKSFGAIKRAPTVSNPAGNTIFNIPGSGPGTGYPSPGFYVAPAFPATGPYGPRKYIAPCPAEHVSCGGMCIDASSDPANCGQCGKQCPGGTTCKNGACVSLQPGNKVNVAPTCPGAQVQCSGGCTDLSSDSANCGTCGNACASGFDCESGQCVGTQSRCLANETDCGSESGCTNTMSDVYNCGQCGNQCAPGQTCQSGICAGGPLPPPPSSSYPNVCYSGQTLCNGLCTDITGDVYNCGGCGSVCAAGQVCSNGSCLYPDQLTTKGPSAPPPAIVPIQPHRGVPGWAKALGLVAAGAAVVYLVKR